jgi:hypothetical protein
METGNVREFRYSRIRIKFKGESGFDIGGLSKEWFTIIGEEIMKSENVLFSERLEAERREGLITEKSSSNREGHLRHFSRFVGRVMGLAIMDERQMAFLSHPYFISLYFLMNAILRTW